MFNVLPENLKKSLIREYKKRWIIVWCVGVIILEIFIGFFLLPSYVSLVFKEKDLNAQQIGDKAVVNDATAIAIEKKIIDTNNKLSTISTIQTGSGAKTLSALIDIKGNGILYKEIVYQNQFATTSAIVIHGKALNRQTLLSYAKRLESSSEFFGINLPVSNFAQDKDIEFSITLSAYNQ